MKKSLTLIAALISFALTVSAQGLGWNFGAKTEGQYNFSPQNTYELSGAHKIWTNATGSVGLKAGYNGLKIKTSLSASGAYIIRNFFTETDEFKGDLSYEGLTKEHPDPIVWQKGYNDTRDSTRKYVIAFDFSWKISDADNFSFKYDREYEKKIGYNLSSVFEALKVSYGRFGNEDVYHVMNFDRFRGAYSHSFKNSRFLKADFDIKIKKTDNFSEWWTFNSDLEQTNYITEPIRADYDYLGNIYYEKQSFCGVKNLSTKFGLRANNHHDNDSYITINIDTETGRWDADERKTRFVKYTSFLNGPFAEGGMKYGQFDFWANFHLQFFCKVMSEDKTEGYFTWSEPQMVIDSKVGWKPNKSNNLVLKFKRSANRPSYDQLNPFLLPGTKPDEFIIGNPKLKAAISDILDFSYSYTVSKFTVTAGAELNLSRHEIENTVSLDTVYNVKYRSWINSASSRTFNLKLEAAWKGEKLLAEASCNYKQNQTFLTTGKGIPGKKFTVKAKAAYLLPWSLKLSADMEYASPSKKAFTTVYQYYTLNARLEKSHKKFKFWIAGLHLLDHTLRTTTTNAEETFILTQTFNYYRRQLQIGLSYNF